MFFPSLADVTLPCGPDHQEVKFSQLPLNVRQAWQAMMNKTRELLKAVNAAPGAVDQKRAAEISQEYERTIETETQVLRAWMNANCGSVTNGTNPVPGAAGTYCLRATVNTTKAEGFDGPGGHVSKISCT
jgi:hypothetical protein